MFDENITASTTSDYSLNPQLSYLRNKTTVEWCCLKHHKIGYTHGKTVKLYTVYEISKYFNINIFWTLKNCLFGAVILTKISINIL